jgi:NodT family efflux transporter outer membrane factor (OMF) lipoprotein
MSLRNRLTLPAGVAAMLIVIVALGCSPAPQIESTPPVEVPESFSAPGVEPLPDEWWQAFRDPALSDLVRQALAGNMSLRGAWARLDQARAVARREGAQLAPELTGSASAGHTFAGQSARRGSDFSLGMTVSWEVDLRGKLGAQRDAAVADERATTAALQAAAVRLAAAVASVWYQLAESREQVRLLDEQILTNQRVADLVALRFRNGTARAQEVLRQRQFVEASRTERGVVLAEIDLLTQQLAILLGKPPKADVVPPTARLVDLPALPATGVPAQLVARRPDVQEAWLRVTAANSRLGAAIADRFPRLSLSASASVGADNIGDLFDNWIANLVANLVGPILDAGRRSAEVDRNRAVVDERIADYGDAVLTAFGDVESALTRERRQRTLIAGLSEQIDLARSALERGRAAFANGAGDYLDVLDLLATEQSLTRRLLTAERDLIQARIDLCAALAGGWTLARAHSADG